MTAGIIQIVNYGSQDLYLTGNPEITFFKIVYRRHTNFSSESMEIPFDDYVNFDTESTSTVPKRGDIINNTYLKIILPKIDLKRTPDGTGIVNNADITNYNTSITNYRTVADFMEVNIEAYRKGYETYTAENVTNVSDIVDTITNYMNSDSFTTIINNYINLVGIDISNRSSMLIVANKYIADSVTSKEVIFADMQEALIASSNTQKTYYDLMITEKNIYLDNKNPNIKFAWVDRIGHAIVDYIELYIGGNRIDKHYGDWLNIWYELTNEYNKKDIYDKLIGNIKSLTTFDRNVKPSYTLYIPLQFWFCKNNGLSLPLVALQYHDVYFVVKFRKFTDCAYMEEDKTIYFSHLSQELYLDELTENEGIKIDASFLIDYIHLDSKERKRFAKSSHEYLIEQIQVREYNDITAEDIVCHLDFNHSCKELIWVGQQTKYTQNTTGYTKCNWDKYTANEIDDDSGNITYKDNIVNNIRMDFNGKERIQLTDSSYFNYVIPYNVHKNSPADGINVYSFSLSPEDHQPSGQCNMSRLSKVLMYVNLKSDLTINFRVYTINYNILRFLGGMAGCAYVSG